MAPPNTNKRCKGVQIFRPFVFGSTARLFDPVTNPKPAGTPDDHTHSWTVFVKGVDDVDITYWCKKVTFKLHDSIPNPTRIIENVQPGTPFQVSETGWGEFEIVIKIYYVPEASEKPQTLYHHLRLHPYGTDAEKEEMRTKGEVISWSYEEQLFNEPNEQFFDLLTSPVDRKAAGGKGGKGKGTKLMRGGMVGSTGERTALIPVGSRPGQPYSRETEKKEMRRMGEAKAKVDEMVKEAQRQYMDAERELAALRQG